MPWRNRTRALSLVLLLAATRAEALSAPELCAGDLDPVLTVGWPVGRSAEIPWLTELVERYHRLVGRCPNRVLQLNVAYGTDYELLAWISTGAIDAALLTPLAVDVAGRDRVPLISVETFRHSKVELQPAGATLADFFARVESLQEGGADQVFLTLPSHLSNEFYFLLDAAAQHVEERRLEGEAFWRSLFAHLCFRPLARAGDVRQPCALAPLDTPMAVIELAPRLTRTTVVGDSVRPAIPDPRPGGTLPEWLTIRPDAAARLFRLGALTGSAFPELWPSTRALFDHPPAPEISELISTDPRLGTRGFRFTIGEALGLLDAHGQATGRPRQALVLPGGGVKAAYQTTVLDTLYGRKLLRNRGAEGYGPVPAEALDVDLVTGTSGGALVGYFVARLDDRGPFDLTCRLWFGGPGCPKTLDHTDIFPPADLLRYLSLVVVFVVFSFSLALFALNRSSPFSLGQLALPPAAGPYLARPLLALTATALLVATPFAVRFINGADHQEHIPDVEGLVYLLLALLAMFADQCLVARGDARAPSTGRTAAAVTLGAGLLALVPPLVTSGSGLFPTTRALFELETPFWVALCLLGPIFVVPLILARSRSLGLGTVPGARQFLHGLGEFILLAVLALWLYSGIGGLRSLIDSLGPFLFGLLLVTSLLLFFVRPQTTGQPTLGHQSLYFGSLALAALFLIALARPVNLPTEGTIGFGSLLSVGRAASQLNVKIGSLAVSVGALLLFTGTLFGLAAWRPRYRLEDVRPFATALALCLGHAAASFAAVFLASRWSAEISLFELTPSYWLTLLVAALALAIVGIGAASFLTRGRLLEAFEFLASAHPNGRFRVRRHVRMVHFAVFAWGFWNLVVAPGLYGNGPARRYLEKVALGFCQELDPGTGECRVERDFTAPLLVPANALQQNADAEDKDSSDGSRFFLIVPKSQPCPTLPRSPAGGGQWRLFHVGAKAEAAAAQSCLDLDSLQSIQSMIFASGSPFPVFPAHRVTVPGEPRPEFLIDGGYSNNVPIAPGQNLEIEQVLVVDSTNSLASAPRAENPGKLATMVGSLVTNVLRLPGYLFGRAQVLDLQSRRDFFVVRIAPHRDHEKWPTLTDFRASVVKRMRDTARADLGRRIARVESWGKPRFVRSWRTPERRGVAR